MTKVINLVKHPLFTLVTLALLLRLIGIDHGLPFIFHPDEPTVVRSALGIRFEANPKHFDWPHLFIYLNYFVYMLFTKFRVLVQFVGLRSSFPLFWTEPDIFYLLSRLFSATLGALTVVPVYLSGKYLFTKRVGIFAAFVMATIPFHVWHAHYSLIDVPMVFFVAWVLYFCSKIILSSHLVNYIGAGLMVGLAASTKYNGGLSALSVLLAHLLQKSKKLFSLKSVYSLIVSGLFAILGFIIGTPYALLDFDTFVRADGPSGALWQFANVGSVSWGDYPLQLIDVFTIKLPDDFGYTYFYVFIALVIALLISIFSKKMNVILAHKAHVAFLCISALFILLYISHFEKNRSHYYMLAYPFIAVSVGYALNLIYERLSIQKWQRVLLIVGIVAIPLFLSAKNTYTFYRGDTREILYEKAREFIPEKGIIIHNASAFLPILDKLDQKTEKGLEKIAKYNEGYLLINYDTNYTDLLLYDGYKFDVLADIKADYRLGNNCALIKFTKESGIN